jgi:acyl transferase domain-containing protein/surfactin synthase thioesterase subunit/acyl carrier protein
MRASLDKALVAISSLKKRLAHIERTSREPIAIVGIGCRYPGNVNDPESFWRVLDEGVDAVTEVPAERWDIDALYDPDPDAAGKMLTRSGGFLRSIDQFDPAFFGISQREARSMDPQQRMLLETSWEALERAGIASDQLMGSQTGVFVGLMYQEYLQLSASAGLDKLDGYAATGNAFSIASGRISYVLGLQGPSMTVDTACSSSLVTVHLACQALRNGECSLALAGGAAMMLSPAAFVEFSRLRALSPDGRCKTFSATADGVGWSEGCGMLVLERLSDAEHNGHPVLAVIRGSAVNQDGRSQGMTAPNGPSQETVIRQAFSQASLSPADVQYVECHGTGTPLGDPIEVQALGAVLAEAGRSPERPVLIGSAKSNFGHTQAAAGVAGIIKVVMALQHGRIPKNMHFEAPSPMISWDELAVKVVTEPVEWCRNGTPRRAGVSSFGVSGTNAHVVLEEAREEIKDRAASAPHAEIVVLSGKASAAVEDGAERLAAHLEAHPQLELRDVAYSSVATRTHHEQRLAVVASSRQELLERLRAVKAGQPQEGWVRAEARETHPKIAFVFPGQGSQWTGMGRELLEHEAVFRDSMTACDRAIAAETGWSLLEELKASGPRLNEIEVVQPALFAISVSLAALWRSWGIEPSVVIGQSQGEIAAAHVAGALSLTDAAAVICRRSRLLKRIVGLGEMALVQLPVAEVQAALTGYEAELSVAVVNSHHSTVISGTPKAMNAVLGQLEVRGVFCKRVNVDYASHSPQIDSLRADLMTSLDGLTPTAPKAPMRSTVTGELVRSGELDAAYWVNNLREPVRLADAVSVLLSEGVRHYVEVSAHPVVLPALDELRTDAKVDGVVMGTLVRERPERASMLEGLGRLYTRGAAVSWAGIFPDAGRRVPLPTYAWQRERFWLESSAQAVRSHEAPVAPYVSNGARGIFQVLSHARTVSELLYEIAWRDLPNRSSPAESRPRQRCLVLADHAMGPALAGALEAAGHHCTMLPDPDWARVESLLTTESWDAVVHLWSVEPKLDGAHSPAEAACASVLTTVATMVRAQSTARLWVLTQNGEPAGGADVRPDQAAVWGLGRSIALEHPEIWGGLIDLDDAGPAHAEAIARLASGGAGREDQIALRGQHTFVPRLVRTEPDFGGTAVRIRPDAAYLITGGLGGLGLACARWLTDHGATHLVLVSRSSLPSSDAVDISPADRARLDALSDLRSRGVNIEVIAADSADRTAMSSIISGRPWRGVVHAAGTTSARPLMAPDSVDMLRSTFRAKVDGSMVLYELMDGMPLDFFIMLSTSTAIFGGRGHGHYAAANHFMDGLAHAARRRGVPATSINLGAVRGGMLDAEMEKNFDRMGLVALSQEATVDAIALAAGKPQPQRAIMQMDWARFQFLYEMRQWRFLDEIYASESKAAKPDDGRPRFLDALHRASPAEQPRMLDQFLREQVGEALGVAPAKLASEARFATYGLDSLGVVKLRQQLHTHLGIDVHARELWALRTIAKTVEYLSQKLMLSERPAPRERSDGDAPDAAKWIVVPQPRPDAAIRLFCFPYAGGGPSVFFEWAEHFPPEVELCIVALPGRHERTPEPFPTSIEEIVRDLAPALEPLLDRPFAFFGHCLGAILMFELARVLEPRGHRPIHFFPSGAAAPSRYFVPALGRADERRMVDMLRLLGFASNELLKDVEVLRDLLGPVFADFGIGEAYRYTQSAALDVPFTTFAGTEDDFAPGPLVREWQAETASECSHVVLDGGHYFLNTKISSIAQVVAQDLKRFLAVRNRPSRSAMARVRPPGARSQVLVCVPGTGGDANNYAGWDRGLPEDLEVYAVDLPGRKQGTSELPLASVGDIVDWIIPSLREQDGRSFMLYGHDLGAIVAFEAVRRLRREGARLPDHLFVSAAMAPHTYYFPPLHHLADDALLLRMRAWGIPETCDKTALRADARAMSTYAYRPEQPIEVPITVLIGDRDIGVAIESTRLWKSHTALAFEHRVVPGGHNLVQGNATAAIDVVRSVVDRIHPR